MVSTLLHVPPLSANLIPTSSLSETERCKPSIKYASIHLSKPQSSLGHWFKVRAVKEKAYQSTSSLSPSTEEVTEKFGLEAGLWKIFSSRNEGPEGTENSKSKGDQAKELLAKYGGAYLTTSITLSLISFFSMFCAD